MNAALKWRVVPASAPRCGWIASDAAGERGALFPSHDAAVQFAQRQARADFERAAKNGLIKLASRGVRAAGLPSTERAPELVKPKPKPSRTKSRKASNGKRRYQRLTEAQIRGAALLREQGVAWKQIADEVGALPTTLMMAVRRMQEQDS